MGKKKTAFTIQHPEQVFVQTYRPGEIPEDSIESIRSPRIRGYRIKTTISGLYVESEVYPIWKRRADVPKNLKRKRSRAAQENLNEKNAVKKFVRLANANFSERDIWGTFTYDDSHLPSSMEEAQRNIQNFIRRMKRAREKVGLPTLKYMYVTECHEPGKVGAPVRYHHHVILSGGMSRDAVEEMWTCGGRTQTRRLQPDDYGITGLAIYITKAPQSGKHRWAASKNLVQPVVRTADTKTIKTQVFRAARDFEELTLYFQRFYPKYEITEIAPPAFNDINGGVYLYARMRRKGKGAFR